MKWPARCAIHKVDPKGVVFMRSGTMTATDGAMMVEIPFDGEGPEGRVVDAKSLAHAYRGRGKKNPDAEADWMGRHASELTTKAADGSVLAAECPPNLLSSPPRIDDVVEPSDFVTLRFSAELLAKAAAAMGTDYVEIRVDRTSDAVITPLVIRPLDGGRDGETPLDGARAILGVST